MNRHRALLAVACLALLSAGCVGFLTGSQPLSFSANETVVGDGALQETGYRAAGNQTIARAMNVTVAGQTRRVEFTNYLHSYNRTLDVAPDGVNASVQTGAAAQFTVIATPNAKVAGRSLNPIGGLSAGQLVERFLSGGNSQGGLQFQGNRTVRSLGAERTVSTYRAGSNQSATGGVVFHVATIEHGGDVIIVLASHPGRIDEQGRIDTLIAGLEQLDA